MQSIFIEQLEVDTIIGVHDWERQSPQTLTFDIEIGLPSTRAFLSDSLADTVDYSAVADLIHTELAGHEFLLLERLLQHLCDRIERRFPVSHIRIRVAKGSIVSGAQRVGVVLARQVSVARDHPGAPCQAATPSNDLRGR